MSNDPNIPFEATTVYHNSTTFYFGSNFNLNGEPRVDVARALIRVLEDLTGWRCTSRWPWSPHHGGQTFGSTREIMALTDLTDLRAADYVILLPLNGTARGCHVELGAALAWDKPTYLWRPFGPGWDVLRLALRGVPRRVESRGRRRPQETRGGPLKWTSKRRFPSEPQIRPISAKDAPSVVED